ncbi:early nodulin-like protein 3 [Musa acuminata AAA Group]|uniref:early nodulin-like protein 3 n=1 Tax=Musa acuminata AAA Group TaxID=214697 RepID=UPI0031D91B0F
MEASKGFVGWLLVAEVLLGLLVDSTGAYVFYAGGRDGWVLHPSESYHDWAGRNRFQVNDTIVFRYKKGSDSVLVVTKQDYDQCDVSKPIQKLDGGDSVFKIDRSGPLYFISGAPGKCSQGQKLVVVVMAVRQPPSEPSVPSPASPPHIPPSPSPTPAASPSPSASSPKPSTRPPTPPPSAHPPASPPSTAPAAGSPPPTSSESGGFAPAPAPSGPAADSTSSSSSNAFKMPTVLIVLVMLGASFLA